MAFRHALLYFCLVGALQGGAVVPARLCRLPEQELHQQSYWHCCLVGALEGTTAWLVHLRQVHPLKDYLTSTFFTLPSAERTMFRPFWSLDSLTPSTVKSVAAPSATVVALMPVSGSGAFSPNTKLAS